MLFNKNIDGGSLCYKVKKKSAFADYMIIKYSINAKDSDVYAVIKVNDIVVKIANLAGKDVFAMSLEMLSNRNDKYTVEIDIDDKLNIVNDEKKLNGDNIFFQVSDIRIVDVMDIDEISRIDSRKNWKLISKAKDAKNQDKDVSVISDYDDADSLFGKIEKEFACSMAVKINKEIDDLWYYQVINHIVKKYRIIIEDANLTEKGDAVIITLKELFKKDYDSYLDLADQYSNDYFYDDCEGNETFVHYKERFLSDRLYSLACLIDANKNDVILDVGCGRGELSNYLADYAKEVLAVDYSVDAIKIANQNFKKDNLKFLNMDVLDLVGKYKFNKIVLADVYEHIEQVHLDTLMENLKKISTDDCQIFIHTSPNRDFDTKKYPILKRKYASEGVFIPVSKNCIKADICHINEQSPSSLKQALDKFYKSTYVWTGMLPPDIKDIDDYKNRQINDGVYGVGSNNAELNKKHIEKFCFDELPTDDLVLDFEPEAQKYEFLYDRLQNREVYIPVKVNHNIPMKYVAMLGEKNIFLSYRILNSNKKMAVASGIFTSLNHNRSNYDIKVSFSGLEKGTYTLRITAIQSRVRWFDQGNRKYKEDIEIIIK